MSKHTEFGSIVDVESMICKIGDYKVENFINHTNNIGFVYLNSDCLIVKTFFCYLWEIYFSFLVDSGGQSTLSSYDFN